MAKSLIEFIHLMYLDDNALQVLNSLVKELKKELNKRKRRWKDAGHIIVE